MTWQGRNGFTPEVGPQTQAQRIRGYEHLFGLSERQQTVLRWLETVGQKRALEQFRAKHTEEGAQL